MGKVYTRFQTKTVQNSGPMGRPRVAKTAELLLSPHSSTLQ